jgi:hypothetical protein
MSKPSLMADSNDSFDQKPGNKYWLDVQLRWGEGERNTQPGGGSAQCWTASGSSILSQTQVQSNAHLSQLTRCCLRPLTLCPR